MVKKSAYFKDDILKSLIDKAQNKTAANCRVIASELETDPYVVVRFCEELEKQGLITRVGDRDKAFNKGRIVEIKPVGRYFLEHEGGFKKEYAKYRWNRIWLYTKIVANVANALAIIGISIWAILQSKSSNVETEALKKRIEKLEQTSNPTLKWNAALTVM